MVDISEVIKIAKQAGEIVLKFYNQQNSNVKFKVNKSPVTEADLASNHFIVQSLNKIFPLIPIISEENEEHPVVSEESFWLVDPLDATQSFIDRDGEFTINIGLIINSKPIIGVVYAALSKELYYTDGKIAYKQLDENKPNIISSRQIPETGAIILTSARSNNNDKFTQYMKDKKIDKILPMSSSIKTCIIAEGKADLYPRFGLTMEWDTAAAHAILKAAGGDIKDLSGNSLTYGHANLHYYNPEFIASGR